MDKAEFIYREILYRAIERKDFSFTQKELAESLNTSISNVNHSLKPLRRMAAIKVGPRNFEVVNARKILFYWASIRDIKKSLIFKARVELPVIEIEKQMPSGIIFGAYSAYKYRFKDTPADYSEVYIYSDSIDDLRERFQLKESGNPNLYVLKKDEFLGKYGSQLTLAQLFSDLWNMEEWYAKDFLKALEGKLHGLLE